MNTGNTHLNSISKVDWTQGLMNIGLFFIRPVKEVFFGLLYKTVAWNFCFTIGIVSSFLVIKGWDYRFLSYAHLNFFYPRTLIFHWVYWFIIVTSGFWIWGLWQSIRKQRLSNKLTEVFVASDLVNRLGKLPAFVNDRAVDPHTRRLRITRANLPVEKFKKSLSALESGLQVYIDDIVENREGGTVDIIYARKPMPELITLPAKLNFPRYKFVVGSTRSNLVFSTLKEVSHLLIAGQTGSGKSTFLRQFITTLYVSNRDAQFLLIDLKGGLEFQTFQGMPRIEVVPGIKEAINSLSVLSTEIQKRITLLRNFSCKDIEGYHNILKEKGLFKKQSERLSRLIIIVDEAAEMFISSYHTSMDDAQMAKKILSQVARQGRAVGIHLIVATQRPDVQSLDTQVKANLTGILSFQMPNDASSITVLGNGRASDLPSVPGRAIWKCGGVMVEVQTPILEVDEAEEILNNFITATNNSNPKSSETEASQPAPYSEPVLLPKTPKPQDEK